MTPVILEVILGILLLVYLVAALVREIRRLQRQRMRVRKLYASPVFQDMLPMLEHARKRHLEQVRVDKTGVLITYLFPAGSNSAFLMKPHGYAYLTEEQQDAMRTLLEMSAKAASAGLLSAAAAHVSSGERTGGVFLPLCDAKPLQGFAGAGTVL